MKKDGGSAYPAQKKTYASDRSYLCIDYIQGMTLKDYFAGQSITGTRPGSKLSDAEVQEYARWAYRMADAMIRARGE